MPENVTAIIAQEAIAFYTGEHSSTTAFARIECATHSAWNYYTGILNDAHAIFDALVDLMIDFDCGTWGTGEPDTNALVGR